jgi:hypothetical protein
MGCWDIYCSVCGAPFTPYPKNYFPKMDGIDTEWLADVVVDYKNGVKVDATDYDAYGCFKARDGKTLNIGEAEADGKVRVYHKLCEGKQKPNNNFKEFQRQFFDINTLIKQRKQHLLDWSRNS